ncbi:probable chitinase 10 [Musca vetustissima]|uniref:probable chitinase 10 n=1 Tax=Musca vetustissima TaxID=27455 RepID=UPI002AB6101D|nr:probable chitinase 10 [Musca vetustissima]
MGFNLVYIFIAICYILCPIQALTVKRKMTRQNSNLCANHAVGDLVENPSDCRLFYFCGDDGKLIEASCPYNMFYNPQTKLCDVAEKVPQCKPGSSQQSSSSVQQPSSPVASVNAEDVLANANRYCFDLYGQESQSNSLVFIANPQNCYQYFMCYHGQALVQECSANLYWNPKMGKCDLPTNVNCIPPAVSNANSMQISPAPGGELPLEQETMCPLYGHHIFPHTERCDFFIYCVKGHAILQKCPFFHYFDVESGQFKLNEDGPRLSSFFIKHLRCKILLVVFDEPLK